MATNKSTINRLGRLESIEKQTESCGQFRIGVVEVTQNEM